ncbi:MAG: hypothetical protein JXA99_10465 [Candidatus Lokiarchaeota archaeon]|nr:hypothetical protein [Candidatus Lokiarchaeota archaeon]
MSQADIPVNIQLFGVGILKSIIIRHIAPLTADAVLDKLPLILRGRFSFGSQKYWTIPGIEIYKGLNQSANNQLIKGDIVYNPKTDELIIILEDQIFPHKVNKIGEVLNNIELVQKARNGLNTKISKEKKKIK